ncbi:MAG TPA: DegQ family serine endoprotease [Syntrophorhabdaceae bacterium]|nr:DegQ family serine endoprotease [Syntrophorhabdaceae bacterium]HQM80150.1 DegQ family serine endoprotease [Syntrophorhabdaceae bacterium]
MKKKNWLLIVLLLIAAVPVFVFVKGQVTPERAVFDASRPNIRTVAFDKGLPSFSDLVNQVKPSIVNISTTTVIKGQTMQDRFMGPGQVNPFKDFFGEDFFDKFFGNSPRREFKQRSLGSGLIIDREGYILTNNHVIEKAQTIKVKLSDEKEYDATVIGRDQKTDIALIKISAKQSLPAATFGDSDKLAVGDWVVAIGNPFGLEHTVTAGIVSAKGRVIGAGPYDDFIQTDASINPGNSGGPLLNLKGEVVGINTAIVSGGQGIGFAIPINVAKDMLPQLKTKGKVARGWMGVVIQKVTPEIAKNFGLTESEGALVADVMEGSPAEKAGIKRGDVIVSYNGKKVKDNDQLPRLVGATEVGKKVKVGLIREGKQIEVEIAIAELQEEGLRASRKPEVEKDFGLVVQDITPEIAKHLNLKDKKGVIVTDVLPGSPAQDGDIRSGDIIKEIGRKPIRNLADFREAMKRVNIKEGVVMLIRRDNTTFYTVIRE